MWPDLIQKAKEGGVDVIQTYVFWNGHEPQPGKVKPAFSTFWDIELTYILSVAEVCIYIFLYIFCSIILRRGMI